MKPDQRPGFFRMLWGLFYPFLLYQGISTAISVAAGSLLLTFSIESLAGAADYYSFYMGLQDLIMAHYAEIAGVTAICTIPALFYLYHYDTQKEIKAGVHEEWERVPFFHFILALIMGAAASMALNHLMIYSRLTELLQEGYDAAASLIFQGRLAVEIIAVGILVPVVEELIFRGLAYRRLRWYIKPVPAMILSAVYFGAVHGNWLQGIYAFIIGMLLAFAYERFRSILAPIVIHAGANIISVIVSESGAFDFIYEDDTALLISTVIAMVIFLITFYVMVTYVFPRKKTESAAAGNDSLRSI